MDGQTPVTAAAVFWDWPVTIPAFVGLLSGYQSIYAKFPANTLDAIRKIGSIAYLVTRIVIPIGTYAIWFFSHEPHSHSLIFAAGAGLGTEMLLRSRFYIKDGISSNGQSIQIFKGLFELVEWYQDLWLKWVGTQLADGRNNFVDGAMKNFTTFPDILQRAQKNANGWPQDQKDAINKKLTAINKEFEKAGRKDDAAFIRGLCFAMLDLEGRKGVLSLLK